MNDHPAGASRLSSAKEPSWYRLRTDSGEITAEPSDHAAGLTASDLRYRRLFESSIIGIVVAGYDGTITEANDFFLQLLGYCRDDLPLNWHLMTPPEWQTIDGVKIAELRATGEGVPWEKEVLAKDGRRVPILIGLALLEGSGGSCVGMVIDITKRRRAELRLLDRTRHLEALAAELVLVEERERRRIALGLHDEIGQTLSTARMKLGRLSDMKESLDTDEAVKEIRTLLDAAIEITRSLTFELCSPVLYELGIEAALKSLGKQVEVRHGLRLHFESDGEPKSVAKSTSIVLYRAVRELLFNIVKHAGAENVWLRIVRDADLVRLSVADDGCGFDTSAVDANFDATGGFGLFNVREQLEYLGGRVEITSSPGDGTVVVLTAPMV